MWQKVLTIAYDLSVSNEKEYLFFFPASIGQVVKLQAYVFINGNAVSTSLLTQDTTPNALFVVNSIKQIENQLGLFILISKNRK